MTLRGWGRIIIVASVTGPVMAMRADVGYASAKAGMVGLTRAIAVDTARHGITVNAVAPGWIATGPRPRKNMAKVWSPRLAGAAHPTRSPPPWPGWPARGVLRHRAIPHRGRRQLHRRAARPTTITIPGPASCHPPAHGRLALLSQTRRMLV